MIKKIESYPELTDQSLLHIIARLHAQADRQFHIRHPIYLTVREHLLYAARVATTMVLADLKDVSGPFRGSGSCRRGNRMT